LDEERRSIARELHDEFAQSVTAIRTLAVAILGREQNAEATREAAHMISKEAARLYDAMHSLIPRLAPIALDTLGLAETLRGLIEEWQKRTPDVRISFEQQLPSRLGTSMTLTIYRVVQEALMNALLHPTAMHVDMRIVPRVHPLVVGVVVDGGGLASEWSLTGSFGNRGLREGVLVWHGNS